MSGDSTLNGLTHNDEQPVIFYSSDMTEAKRIVLLHKRQQYQNEILEWQGYSIQTRWRTGSPMQG